MQSLKSFARTPMPFDPAVPAEFMIREWYADDHNDRYTIYLFGVNDLGESVAVEVTGFEPYFFVKKMSSAQFEKVGKKAGYFSRTEVRRKNAYGFNNGLEEQFSRLAFPTRQAWSRAKYAVGQTYDAGIDPMLVFMHITHIQASGWIRLENPRQRSSFSRCQRQYTVDWRGVKPMDHKFKIPKFVTMSFDIETFSHDGTFPKPEVPANVITQIGSAFQRYGDDEVLKTVVVLGECDPVPGVVIISASSEKTLIRKWVQLVAKLDPDQAIGYNIDSFDWEYIWERAVYNGIDDYVAQTLPRLEHVDSYFSKDKMESKAFGVNVFNFVTTPGMGQIDLLHWFRKNAKLDQYSLDFVSEHYLKENKREVTPHQIFAMTGPDATPASRAVVADYCAQDTLLPLRLMLNRMMFPNLIEMSRVMYVPFAWLVKRGEQIKAFSQLVRVLRQKKFVIPDNIKGTDAAYEGAKVLSCDRGFHDQPVAGLDFASLYPSIMIAWNLCITTWVSDVPRYGNLKGVEYKDFDTGDGNVHRFVQSQPGVVPGILDYLWTERKRIKKQMKAEEDPETKAILNAKQLAIKLSMNSIYGFFGVSSGIVPCQSIAASVTCTGREMIKHSMKCAEEWYDGVRNPVHAKVVYGDSVRGDTPMEILTDSGVDRLTIAQLFDRQAGVSRRPYPEFKPWVDAEKHRVPGYGKIMTRSGYSEVRKIIRHRTQKKMYRVTTPDGSVVVTEDHSLLTEDGAEIKPQDVKPWTKLMSVRSVKSKLYQA